MLLIRRSPAPLLAALLTTAVIAGCDAGRAETQEAGADPALAAVELAVEAPTELFEVVRVVDGDTIHIQRGGEVQKLRLLSVDTEEKLSGRTNVDPNKPETVYGQACADWAVDFFATRALVGGVQKVGLRFPEGVERADVYGRLLCHVLLPDGTDFNLLLVAEGRSPYFNKYGNSLIDDAGFRAAQESARERQLGIWDPATNQPADADAPAAKRPYDRLLPWWERRAVAIDEYRARAAEDATVLAADEPDGLAAWLDRGTDEPVEVFGAIDRIFDEDDGSVTLLMRGDRQRAFRARIAADAVASFDRAALERTRDAYEQNYVWIRCRLRRDRSGFDAVITDPARIRTAD